MMKVLTLSFFSLIILFNLQVVESSTVRCGPRLFETLREACTPSGYKNPCFTANDVFVNVDGKEGVNLHENIVHLCCTGSCTPEITSQLCCNEIEQATYDLTNMRNYPYRF